MTERDQEYLARIVRQVAAHCNSGTLADPFDEESNPVRLLEAFTSITEKVVAESASADERVTVAVADMTGECLYSYHMPGSILAARQLARQKAYTAVAMKSTTKSLHDKVQPNRELYQLETVSDGRIVTFAGGIPLYNPYGRMIGAVGVSGASPEEDHRLAELFIREFNKTFFCKLL